MRGAGGGGSSSGVGGGAYSLVSSVSGSGVGRASGSRTGRGSVFTQTVIQVGNNSKGSKARPLDERSSTEKASAASRSSSSSKEHASTALQAPAPPLDPLSQQRLHCMQVFLRAQKELGDTLEYIDLNLSGCRKITKKFHRHITDQFLIHWDSRSRPKKVEAVAVPPAGSSSAEGSSSLPGAATQVSVSVATTGAKNYTHDDHSETNAQVD
ncbi:unnamed protein product, partial [Amoebophrya sp. A120]|eukprot:GSA120T00018791001.1